MPIRNLTARMPRLGKVHLGVVVTNDRGAKHPKAIDHFACPPTLLEALRGKVPFCDGKCGVEPGPVELPIMFLSNDQERVASQWFRAYKATVNLVCRGDGYKADAMLDRDHLVKSGGDVTPPMPVGAWYGSSSKSAVRREIACLGEGYDGQPACPMYAAKACRRLMMLQFAVPDAPGLGVYQLDTGSVNSMLNVNGFIEYLQSLTGGRIVGIPLRLVVEPQEVTAENRKKTVYVLRLTSEWTLGQLAEAVRKPAVLSALLPDPEAPEPDDAEAVVADADDVEEVDVAEEVEDVRDVAARVLGNATEDQADTVASATEPDDADNAPGDPATEAQLKILASLWRRIKGRGESIEHSAYTTMRDNYPFIVESSPTEPEFPLLNQRAAASLIEELEAIVGNGR